MQRSLLSPYRRPITWFSGLATLLLCCGALPAEEEETRVLLRYKFKAGETIRWKVVHLATTETTIQGNTQESKSRSASVKAWQIQEVDAEGSATVANLVENVEMWQKITDRPEVRYNSKTDEEAPPEYEHVAKTVGVPLATVILNNEGSVLKRDGTSAQARFGLGDMAMLLPPKPVKQGSSWYEPSEIPLRNRDGSIKKVKIRKRYTLQKLATGVATIRVKTEVLTPVNAARLKAQLVQQLTEGTIKFDVDAGRMISQQIDWDTSVVGFNGAESNMKYLARFTEQLLTEEEATEVASKAGEKKKR